jgi:predicted  nucleic acid-binding Zn-ribbon protein
MPKVRIDNLSRLNESFNSIGKVFDDLVQALSKILSETDNRLKDLEAKYLELEKSLNMIDSNFKNSLEKINYDHDNLKNESTQREAELQRSIKILAENQKSILSAQGSLEISVQKLNQKFEELNTLMEKRLLEITENISAIIFPVENWNKEMNMLKAEVGRLSREMEKKLLGEK